MKLNFNNTNLSQESTMATMTHPTNTTIDFTSTKLKVWWQGLPQEEKQKVCTLDATGIMSDLANAANNALVVCKLNHTYKKKDLISWTKCKSQDATIIISQTFAFNFVGKEVLEDCLAELFSCFYIFITRCRKPEEFSDNEGQSCPNEPKSHIGVNEERLDSLLDFLSHSICNFGDGRKPLFLKKDSSELYFSLINDPSHKMMFNNTTLPAYLKVLFERLTVYSFLLEHQIYKAYFEATTLILDQAVLVKEQERVEHSIISQLASLSPLVSTTPPVVKTVSQLEKECSNHELSIDQNSTASGSPRNPIALATPQNLNLEELSQKLLQKSPKEQSTGSMVRELSYSEQSSETKFKVHEEFVQHNKHRKNSSAIPVWNEIYDPTLFTYEGCLVGNLQIPFDIMDLPLMEADEPTYGEQEEQRDFGIIEFDELFDAISQQENGDVDDDEKEDYQVESSEGNMNSFNMPSGPMMNFQSVYPGQQPYLYANSEFYSSYCAQQNYTMMSYNYTVPMMYMTQPNTLESSVQNDSTYYQQVNYTVENTYYGQTQRQEPQVHYENDNSYYQTQKFGEHYKNDYEGHHQGQGDEKSYYAGRDKPRYDMRPKLPPRFQKRKENMLRT